MSGSNQKRGLGRGLGALLGDAGTAPASHRDGSGAGVREIAVAQITPNPFQPRKSFDEDSLGELKRSIAEFGVLVPVIVRERNGAYELIAGERRWRASAALQRPTIPAIMRTSDDRDSLEVAIVENLQREDLNALEEAAGIKHLIDEYGFTQEQAADRLGKSRPAVANALRLLALAEPIKAMLVARRLTAGHARALLSAPESHRLALAERAAGDGMTVRALERLALALSAPRAPKAATAESPLSPDQREFESRLRVRLGTRVALRRSGAGGKIEIRYGNEKDLIRIAELLVGTVD
ncbi:MAG TPA: ParB/RepB/Spo0J family partition protein [Candidatus Baltobacteraceae bacterium]|jgi:ParB family chromosome partitioning protein